MAHDAQALGRLLALAARSLKAVLTEKLSTYGLTSAQCAVLAAVAEMEKAGQGAQINAASVGARLQRVDRTTMSGIIRRLVRDGWVTVESDPTDRRVKIIGLTEKARDLLPSFDRLWDETVGEAARGLNQAEISTLTGSLRKLITNLEPHKSP